MIGVLRASRRRPAAFLAAAVLVAMAGVSFSAPLWVRSPNTIDVLARLMPPSAAHWFGTDNLGRDLFSRIVYGAQVSLEIGFAVMAGSTLLGAVSGLLAGYYPRIDAILMRFLDGLMAFPAILLALAMVAALGANTPNEIIALTVVFWPRTARIVRASTLQLRSRPFVEAAVALGADDRTILTDHILANALNPLIIQSTFVYAEAMLADAALSFLGLGVKPPTPTWGNILGDARAYLVDAPWFSVFAGVAIVLAVLSLNVVGDALRDVRSARSLE